MGAVGEGGALVVNERVAGRLHLAGIEFAEVERRERPRRSKTGRCASGCTVLG